MSNVIHRVFNSRSTPPRRSVRLGRAWSRLLGYDITEVPRHINDFSTNNRPFVGNIAKIKPGERDIDRAGSGASDYIIFLPFRRIKYRGYVKHHDLRISVDPPIQRTLFGRRASHS